jgi:phosphoribosylaminoimidazole (AIR) synthetase
VVSEKDAEQTLQALKENNTDAWQLGHIESSSGAATVRFE